MIIQQIRKTDKEVLRMVNAKRGLVKHILERQLSFPDYVLRRKKRKILNLSGKYMRE